MGSTVVEVLEKSAATVIVTHDDDVLPEKNKGSMYVIAVDNNQSSTKAFLDALSISSEGDRLKVVHVIESKDGSDEKAEMLRNKYEFLFTSESLASVTKGKTLTFNFLPKKSSGTVAEKIVTHSEEVDAQFICIGAANLHAYHGGLYQDAKSRGSVIHAERALRPSSLAIAASICHESSCSVMISQFDESDCMVQIEQKKVARKNKEKERRGKRLKHMDSFRLNRDQKDDDDDGADDGDKKEQA